MHSHCERSILKIESDRDIGQSNMIYLVFSKCSRAILTKVRSAGFGLNTDYLLSGGIQLEYSFRSDCYEHSTPAKWSRMRCYGNFQSIKHLLLLDLHSHCERSVLKIESDRDIGQSNMIHLVFYKMFKSNINKGLFCRLWFEYQLSFERGNTTWI